MGAVRIYKQEDAVQRHGYSYIWAVRSDGCDNHDAWYCDYGEEHEGVCNDFTCFEHVLLNLNDEDSELGAYLKK